MSSGLRTPSAIIIGVGPEEGLGAAVARRFAAAGYHVFVGGRTAEKVKRVADAITASGDAAEPLTLDATRPEEVERAFDQAFAPRRDLEPPTVVVFNAGNNQPIDFLDLTPAQFEEFWRVGCFAGFLTGQAAARRLLPGGKGTILFTGATASLRGRPRFAQFAAAKAGLRMISQSMAREFGPQGLHVAHVLIDGAINGERLKVHWPDAIARRGEDGLLEIDAIAEAYWQLHLQHKSAWTQELDLRPFKEFF